MYPMEVIVESPNVKYTPTFIDATYTYQTTKVHRRGDTTVVTTQDIPLNIRTRRNIPKMGVMLVGWGGNNGSTFTAGVLANKHGITWNTTNGKQGPNWYGSITQSSTINMGYNSDNEAVHMPMKSLLPIGNPDDIVLDGWDISALNLADAMTRSQVVDYDLQAKLRPHMQHLVPRRSVYYPDFIASNQASRANNVLEGSKWDHVQQLQADIRDFRTKHVLDTVIVIWTANTERLAEVVIGINDTSANLLQAIKSDSPNVSPSTIYAVAAILEGCIFINGSPQNTFVPGCLELADERQVYIAGDDFKSGQTKLKTVLVDFLISAGIKPLSIASYNHLGNNDGFNLSFPQQFQSKEVSKTNVIDDLIKSNSILYKTGEKPDHCVVIKYVPTVGDSKRAMDEYTSELMLGGRNTLVVHNTCQDSILAAPIILDLVLLAELMTRIQIKTDQTSEYTSFHSALSVLSYLCKAPLVPRGTAVVNSLVKQRACIENIFRACLSLPPENNMLLEFKLRNL